MVARFLAGIGISGLVLTSLAPVSGCRSVPGHSPGPGGAPGDSLQSLERAASLAAEPAEKARAYVGVGRAALEAGDPRKALWAFYEARRVHYEGTLATETNRGIGEAYFEMGEYSLARRYLSKGAGEARAPEGDIVTAKLVVCFRAMEDVLGATAYRGRLSQPFSEEVRRVLAMEPRAAAPPSARDDDEDEPPVLVRPERGIAPRDEQQPPSQEHLRVYSRESWDARAPRRNIEPMGHVDKITVHHSGGENFWSSSPVETAAEIRKIQRYHQNEQGWADIGYHYIIDRTGAIWQGRRLRYQGAHARGSANYGNVGIVLLGNYMSQGITAVQRLSLETLIEKLCERFEIPPQRVYTHREILHGKTDCPGPALERCVSEIRSDLRRRLVAYRP